MVEARDAVLRPFALPSEVEAAIRVQLPQVADDIVETIVGEVPSYENAFVDQMGEVIRNAVQLALRTFLSLVSKRPDQEPSRLLAPAVDGAYQLGRGEARSGRTIDALLSAYRIGARVAWRELSGHAVAHEAGAPMLAEFAESVFAYIDQLSAASAAGHADESASTGRVRQRLHERIAQAILEGAPESTVARHAERAEWPLPRTLTAVIAPEAQVGTTLQSLPAGTLPAADLPDLEGATLLLAPDLRRHDRAALVKLAEPLGCVVGPSRPWLDARSSYTRALRARQLGLRADTEQHLPQLVLTADAEALADLRERSLTPLADLRPATREKLADTLRAWLLHQGRRDEVAAALFVHPQTVRYRMSQLRDAYGDRLEDPETVLALTIALAIEPPADPSTEPPAGLDGSVA